MLEKCKTNFVHACKRANLFSKELLLLCTCAITSLHFGHVTGECFDLVMTWIPSLISFLLNFVVLGEGTIALQIEPDFLAFPPESNKISLSFDMLVAHPKCLV